MAAAPDHDEEGGEPTPEGSTPGDARMPNIPIFTFIPKVNEFIAHWNAVNTALGGGGLTLGTYNVAGLTADRDSLNTLYAAVEAADNIRQTAGGDRDIKKAALRERLRQFRNTVKGRMAGSSYIPSLPPQFRADAKTTDAIRRLSDMGTLWTTINSAPPPGFTAPLLLSGAYAVATFNADLAALQASALAYTNGAFLASVARENRNALINPVVARLVQYRLAVIGAFPANSALILALPTVYPLAGATPNPVNLSGIWDASLVKARLIWAASGNPNLTHYSVRYHPGPRYKASEEQAVAVVAGNLTTFDTDFGLAASGSVSYFKVYVVVTTGNEKGSNSVRVLRL